MAKKKRSHSSSSRSSAATADLTRQVTYLLVGVFVIFLLAAVFDKAGTLGSQVHRLLAQSLGVLTPVYAALIIWGIAYRFIPSKVRINAIQACGLTLWLLGLAGFVHVLVGSSSLTTAMNGQGGGMLGYLLTSTIISSLGMFAGSGLLIIFIIAGIMLTFGMSLPIPTKGESTEDEDGVTELESSSRVQVKGEIAATNAFNRLLGVGKKREADIVQPVAARKNAVDSVRIPVRTSNANWSYPPTNLLDIVENKPVIANLDKRIESIRKTLGDFGIDVEMREAFVGPTVTQFTLKPADGVKLNQITARQDDLSLALAAQSLRVEAPIPGKSLVGVEIPNDKKAVVGLRTVLEAKQFKMSTSSLTIGLGLDAAGVPAVADIARMPHALIAGSTGSGKSVMINAIITTLLMNNSPEELRLILVDPKRVELTGYNGLPHLLTPVITEAKDTVAALNWCVKEMERRYKLLNSTGKRNIEQYNEDPEPNEGELPFIVVVIDELADLMMVAAREVEGSIVRLAQMARAVGIHLLLATQRPSVDVITGLIKANIPTRIAFAVASQIDSRTIIDMSGAEKLLGRGDMLYISTDVARPRRVQGMLVTDKEINSVIAYIKQREVGDRYDPAILETRVESRLGGSRDGGDVDDELFEEAFEVVRQAGKASSTLLQTRLSVGYARAARLIQIMEDKGLIGPAKGSKPREVYGNSVGGDLDEVGIAAYPENE